MDIERVLDFSKEMILDLGEMPACLFVELDHTDVCIVRISGFEHADDADERAQRNFLCGRSFAQKKLKKRTITGVCSALEVWYLATGPETTHYEQPSKSKHRKEGLTVSHLDPTTMKQKAWIFEMIRSDGGKLIDLLREIAWNDNPQMEIQSPLLPAFLAGVNSAKRPINEATHALRRVLEKHSVTYAQMNKEKE